MTRGTSKANRRYAIGTPVEITVKGIVTHSNSGDLMIKLEDNSILMAPRDAITKAIIPPHSKVRPGQVWDTPDGLYFARISRSDIPLRLTPADLSNETGLKTLAENEFFIRYPAARPIFNGVNFAKMIDDQLHDQLHPRETDSRNGFLAPASK
jgi:hypothetical protein